MKNLQEYISESILKSTGSGMEKIDAHDITNIRNSSTFNDVIDMKKLYKDIEKKHGKKPSYSSEAFAQILISKPILKRYYDLFFDEDMNPQEKNQKVTEAILDIFKDYIKSKKDLEFNFYCHRSNIYKGFELGIHYKSSFKNRPISENILILKK